MRSLSAIECEVVSGSVANQELNQDKIVIGSTLAFTGGLIGGVIGLTSDGVPGMIGGAGLGGFIGAVGIPCLFLGTFRAVTASYYAIGFLDKNDSNLNDLF